MGAYMANNKPLRKYLAVESMIKKMTAPMLLTAGWFITWTVDQILKYSFRLAARQGIYMMDVGHTYITTNMDEATFLSVAGDSWTKVEAGVTPEVGKTIDDKYMAAFDKFAVFTKVKK